MKTFVTADMHFYHRNIIKYCNRPFDNVREMNDAIRSIWNHLVRNEDVVFVLGDCTFTGGGSGGDLLDSLNGKKILIVGNHDPYSVRHHPSWRKVCKEFHFEYKGTKMHLRHYPWQETVEGELFLHGHSHGNLGVWHDNQIDVGVDCWDFAPVELEELIEFWKEKRKWESSRE